MPSISIKNTNSNRERLVLLCKGKRVPPKSLEYIEVTDYELAQFKQRQKQNEG